MFDFVAKHKRLLQIILALTMVPFVFFGLDAYTRSGGNAKVKLSSMSRSSTAAGKPLLCR